MKKIVLAASCAAFATAMALAAPAAASVYVTTWTGVVDQGFDETGVFGADHTVLDGMAFKATFSFDDGLPGSVLFDNSFVSEIFGGRANHDPNNQLTGTLTLEGKTYDFTPSDGSFFLLRDAYPDVNNGNDEYRQDVQSALGDPGGQSRLNLDAFSNRSSFLSDHDYRTPFTYAVSSNAVLTGDFSVYIQGGGTAGAGSVANGTLTPKTFSVALKQDAGVPEPASWALMISGFGLAGAMLRRRRSALHAEGLA